MKSLAAVMGIAVLVLGGAGNAMGVSHASCDPRLKRQNAALTARVTKLTKQTQQLSGALSTANAELATSQQALDKAQTDLITANTALATTKAQLGAAQTGVPGTILTMQAVDVWNHVLPAVTTLMRSSGSQWQADTYSSGDYLNIQYTWCGFC